MSYYAHTVNVYFLMVAMSEIVYFYIKELYKAKQEIQKSTYFAFHSHKTQKVMSTFFIPCFVGVFSGVAIAAPPQLQRLAATQLAEIQCRRSNTNCST